MRVHVVLAVGLCQVACARNGEICWDDADGPPLRPCFSDEQFHEIREADFAVLTKGHSYDGALSIVAECTETLAIGDAYPGISSEAVFGSIFAERFDSVAWKSPNAPSPTGLLFLVARPAITGAGHGPQPGLEGFDMHVGDDPTSFWPCNDGKGFVNAFPYAGATAPGVDAGITCGNVHVTSKNAMIVRELFAKPNTALPPEYGVATSVFLGDLEHAYESVGDTNPISLTQETFVGPQDDVAAVVGTTNVVPPLPPPPASTRCGGF